MAKDAARLGRRVPPKANKGLPKRRPLKRVNYDVGAVLDAAVAAVELLDPMVPRKAKPSRKALEAAEAAAFIAEDDDGEEEAAAAPARKSGKRGPKGTFAKYPALQKALIAAMSAQLPLGGSTQAGWPKVLTMVRDNPAVKRDVPLNVLQAITENTLYNRHNHMRLRAPHERLDAQEEADIKAHRELEVAIQKKSGATHTPTYKKAGGAGEGFPLPQGQTLDVSPAEARARQAAAAAGSGAAPSASSVASSSSALAGAQPGALIQHDQPRGPLRGQRDGATDTSARADAKTADAAFAALLSSIVGGGSAQTDEAQQVARHQAAEVNGKVLQEVSDAWEAMGASDGSGAYKRKVFVLLMRAKGLPAEFQAMLPDDMQEELWHMSGGHASSDAGAASPDATSPDAASPDADASLAPVAQGNQPVAKKKKKQQFKRAREEENGEEYQAEGDAAGAGVAAGGEAPASDDNDADWEKKPKSKKSNGKTRAGQGKASMGTGTGTGTGGSLKRSRRL